MVTTPFTLSLAKGGGVQNPAYRSAGSPVYTSTLCRATALWATIYQFLSILNVIF